jgi:hypothetical protein
MPSPVTWALVTGVVVLPSPLGHLRADFASAIWNVVNWARERLVCGGVAGRAKASAGMPTTDG